MFAIQVWEGFFFCFQRTHDESLRIFNVIELVFGKYSMRSVRKDLRYVDSMQPSVV